MAPASDTNMTATTRQGLIEAAGLKPMSRGEAHVFYDKTTLLNFLNDVFAKDEKNGEPVQAKMASEGE